MNAHFQRENRHDEYRPLRAYGRIDSIELPAGDEEVALVAIDMIDAEWLDLAQSNPLFSLTDSDARSKAWRGFPPRYSTNPFEGARLFRLEIEVSIKGNLFENSELGPIGTIETGNLESYWLTVEAHPEANTAKANAYLYSALFSDPSPVIATGKLVTASEGKALSDIFSLTRLPAISTGYFETLISNADAEYLAAYDVGQGNANALLDSRLCPTLFFDLGAGVYRNKRTTPPNLLFCFNNDPLIILSHWDADHWAGAYANTVGGLYPALQQRWIAPLQAVGPTHVAFAYDVLQNGGKFYTYHPLKNTVGVSHIAPDESIRFTAGTGTDRNSSGIVLEVVNQATINGPRSWLLTGDCEYKYFMPALAPADPVAIIAPHHGADLHGGSTAPPPVANDKYRRLVYSFGADNLHGKTNVQHPTPGGLNAHLSWDHGAWNSANIGNTIPGGDVLATALHSPNTPHLGGALVGWNSPPALTPPLCKNYCCWNFILCSKHIGPGCCNCYQCTTELKQS